MRRFVPMLVKLGAGIAALVGALSWLSGACGAKIAPGESASSGRRPAAGPSATVERRIEPAFERASGTLVSARETTVSAKILARIESVRVRAGSLVQRGDVLVTLDDRDLTARLSEAREKLRAARARLELARREQERVHKLLAEQVASEKQLDQARAAFRVAQADVQAAEQHVTDAEVALSDANIRSPVTGRAVDRLAEPGDMAAPGVPLLRVYDPSALRMEVPVRERLAVGLAVGQTLRVHLDALEETLEGRIEEIVPFAEPGARTLLVKIRLPENPRLFAGLFGRVEVPAGQTARLLVPKAAITRIGQLAFATAVGAEGQAERRWVTTGLATGDGRIEVLSGLRAGERVLLPEAP